MIRTRDWRTWAPVAAFILLAGGWYVANLFAYRATLQTMHAADARIVAAGHDPVFTNFPSLWDWQQNLRPALFGIIGAAIVALLLRRVSRWPLFLLAGALPVVIGHAEHLHGWWAPGLGIDQWTFGAGVATRGLDLSTFGAGPSWALVGGTVLAVAAVVVPALLARPATRPLLHGAKVARALPYVVCLGLAAALATGALHVDSSGDGSSHEMLVAAIAAALIATLTTCAVSRRSFFWPDLAATAIAVGLLTVSGLNPGAMSSTKWAAFGAAAGIAVIAALITRKSLIMTKAVEKGARKAEILRISS